MAIKVGVGRGDGVDAFTEASTATKQALASMQESFADSCLVFASPSYDQQKVLHGVRSVAGENAVIIGSSTAGEIVFQGSLVKSSIVVMAFRSNTVSFFGAVGDHLREGSARAAKEMIRNLKLASGGTNFCVAFTDVLSGNGEEVVDEIGQETGAGSFVGAASGDDFIFDRSYQYLNETVYSGAVVGLGFKGSVKGSISSRHGWIPIGVPKIVNKSEAEFVYEIDNKPALDFYREYFGENVKDLSNEKLAKLVITYPLGYKVDGFEEMLIRSPIFADSKGAIKFSATVPQGTEVQLMIGSAEEALRAGEVAIKEAIGGVNRSSIRAVLVFSSVSRRKLLGERADEEIRLIQKALGDEVPLAGFYGYGEIGPVLESSGLITNKRSIFQGKTLTICVIAE